MNKLAPIVLFVYKRPWHTQKVIEMLQKNELANESELFIYADGAKNDEVLPQVSEVRNYIKTIKGFKKVTIVEQDKNCGLANSIINGVTKVINQYDKVIVLEDDIVTSPYFLKFMNDALDFYENKDKVWHISGWNYPIEAVDGLHDVFLWRGMNCWGWATWSNRWQYYEKNIDKTIYDFSKEDIIRFNIDGFKNIWGGVLSNKNGKTNTWAIFWYAVIFKKNGLCLNPVQTFVKNIGFDGSGEHRGLGDFYEGEISSNNNVQFVNDLVESKEAVQEIKIFYKSFKKTLIVRVVNKISRLFWKKNLIK